MATAEETKELEKIAAEKKCARSEGRPQSAAPSSGGEGSKPDCFQWLKGHCAKGDQCKYAHADGKMGTKGKGKGKNKSKTAAAPAVEQAADAK